ncbi:helix-turn-helix domain-containing protein [Romboutsia sedimentorum]|uniref:helix-turn-helix domain-containing protein n=1 Tax=Romboutsia sedimentorum TaxID=1368474 RepID=UPI0024DEEEA6|nr:helix-turn-helix domain-containing protein [Romboutsia sedimentorum]MDK2587287.1 helix-turn-helix domain-containing protein [Romboutsia sedimentorum]
MIIRWNYIYDEMKIRKLTNTEMCKRLGISRDTWHKYKNNQSDISLRKFYELMKILDLDFYSIVKETELSKPKTEKEKILKSVIDKAVSTDFKDYFK